MKAIEWVVIILVIISFIFGCSARGLYDNVKSGKTLSGNEIVK